MFPAELQPSLTDQDAHFLPAAESEEERGCGTTEEESGGLSCERADGSVQSPPQQRQHLEKLEKESKDRFEQRNGSR